MRSPRPPLCHAGALHRVARGAALLVAAGLAGGCGDEEIPPDPEPTAADALTYFGLNDGSCVRYRFAQQGVDLFATAEVRGPDTSAVAGRSVYRRTFRLSSGGLADEEFVEPQEGGALRLVRFDTTANIGGSDMRQSKRYPDGAEPILVDIDFDDMMQPSVELGERFEVTTTPMVSQGEPQPEAHTVVVQATDVSVSNVPYESEAVPGVELIYTRAVGTDQPATTQYTLVPGRGFARIIDGGTTYVACDWRICDASGSCTGAPSCNQLSCN